MTVEEAFIKLKKIKEAEVSLKEKSDEAKEVIMAHMKTKGVDKMIGEGVSANITVRTSYEIVDDAIIPEEITLTKSVSVAEVTKWQNKHATSAVPSGLTSKVSEPSLTIRFGKE